MIDKQIEKLALSNENKTSFSNKKSYKLKNPFLL